MFFYVCFALFLIVVEHYLLEDFVGEFYFTHLSFAISAEVEEELVVRIQHVLCLDAFLHLCTECFFAFYSTFAKYSVEEFLVDFSGYETADFVYLEAKVASVLSNFFLLHLQERRNFSFVAFVCLWGIDNEDIVYLSTVEERLLFVVLKVSGHKACAFYNDTAFNGLTVFVKLSEDTAKDVTFFVRLNIFGVTSLLRHALHLSVNHFFSYVDVVVINSVVRREFYVHFGWKTEVEVEYEVVVLFDINLIVVSDGFAENVEVIFLDVSVELFADELLNFFSLDLCAVHLLYHTSGYVTRTETGHLHLLLRSLKTLLYVCFVISLLNIKSKYTSYITCLLKSNIHFSFCLWKVYNICGRKINIIFWDSLFCALIFCR